LERPLEVNATDPHGRSALHLALLNEDKHSLLHLLGAGADPNLVSKDGQTPLMLAADKASGIFVRELLDAGAEINASDHQGRTALMIAADHQRTTCIKVLLEGGADPMLRDVEGHRAIDREGLPPRAEELLREASQQQRKSQLPPINDKLAALMGGMLEGSLKLLNESDSITELEQKGVDLIGQLTSDEQMAAWLGKLEETAIQSEIKFWLDLLVEIREILRLQQQQLRQQDLSETDAPRNWQKQVLWLAQQYREQLEDGLVITPSENV
ncbi:MAG: ankyrin repeat domain-containing protein, partial [Bacteroidota bacterium]